MRIQCPQCTSQYNVDEKRIPPQGVQIKCPKCQTSFVVEPPTTQVDAATFEASLMAPPPAPPPAAPPPAAAMESVPLPGMPRPGTESIPLPGAGVAQDHLAADVRFGDNSGVVALPGQVGEPSEDVSMVLPAAEAAGAAGLAASDDDIPFASDGAIALPSAGEWSDDAVPFEAEVTDAPPIPKVPTDDPFESASMAVVADAGVVNFIEQEAARHPQAPQGLSLRIRKKSGKVVGPFSEQQILSMLRSQEFMGSEDASEDGASWRPLSSFPAFAEEVQALMASSLQGMGDLPAPVAPDVPSDLDEQKLAPAMTPSSPRLAAVPEPTMEPTPAVPSGAAAQPAAAPEPKKKKKKEKVKKEKKPKVPGAKRKVPVLAILGLFVLGAVGAVAFVTMDDPDAGLFFHKQIMASLEPPPPPPPPKPPQPSPSQQKAKVANLEALLVEDNLAAYSTVQRRFEGDSAPTEGNAALVYARALALPGFLDAEKDMSTKAATVLDAAGSGEVRMFNAMKAFTKLGLGQVDDALKLLLEAAGKGQPNLKDATDIQRTGEFWLQTAYGFALLQQGGHLPEAMQHFDWALALWESNVVALQGQARAAQAAGDRETAEGYLDKAVTLQPDNIRSLLALGEMLLRDRNFAQARVRLERVAGPAGAKGSARQRARAHDLLSDLAWEERNFKDAVEQLKLAAAEVPTDVGMKVKVGNLHLRLRDWPQARQLYDEILATQPDLEGAIIGSARAKIGSADALGAFKQLQDATTKKPNSAPLAYWFGAAQEALSKTEEAVKQYKRQSLDPTRATPVVAEARISLRARRYTEAVSILEGARPKVAVEEQPLLTSTMAQVHVKQREFAKAFREFEDALKANPQDADTRAQYGAALRDTGRFDDSLKQLKQALLEDPKNAMILAEMGSYYHSQGQYERAIDYFQQAIGISPKEADFYIRMGASTYKKGDNTGAVEFLKTAQTLAPTNPDVLYWMGMAVRKTDMERAKSLFKQGIDLAPEDGRFEHELARTVYMEGAIIEAIDYLRTAVRKDPKNGEAYFEMGKYLAEQGRMPDAREQYEKAMSVMPGKAYIHMYVAETFSKTGEYDAARREFQEAVRQDPSLAEAHCKLGDVYRTDQKLKAAVDAYKKCLELNPKHKEAWKWLGHVYADLRGKPNQRKAVEAWTRHLELVPEDAEELNDLMADFKH